MALPHSLISSSLVIGGSIRYPSEHSIQHAVSIVYAILGIAGRAAQVIGGPIQPAQPHTSNVYVYTQ